MKTAGRENPHRWTTAPRNRAHGAAGPNRSRSIKGAAKQEKFQPQEMCFFLTSTFIELIGSWLALDHNQKYHTDSGKHSECIFLSLATVSTATLKTLLPP